MKKTLFAAAALLLATSASAVEGKPSLGVGFALGGGTLMPNVSTTSTLTGGVNKILVPINVSAGLRVEPFLGYVQHRTKDSSDPAGDVTNWNSVLTLGASVVLLQDVGQNVELIYGGRLSVLRVANGFEDKPAGTSGDDSFIGFGIAAVGGAEYYFSPRFALGVEAELGYDTVESERDLKETNFGTAAFLTARVFFK